jgi:hypothetical protein
MHVDNSITKVYWGSDHFAPIDRSSIKICRQEKEFWGVSNVNTWGQTSSNHDLQNDNGNTLIYSTCTVYLQIKWFFRGEQSGGDFLGDLALLGWEGSGDSWPRFLETDCWGGVLGQWLILDWGDCEWWVFAVPCASWAWLQETVGILFSPLPLVPASISSCWLLNSAPSPARVGGDCLLGGDSWFGDKATTELLWPLKPAAWLPVGLLRNEECLLWLQCPDLHNARLSTVSNALRKNQARNLRWQKRETIRQRMWKDKHSNTWWWVPVCKGKLWPW